MLSHFSWFYSIDEVGNFIQRNNLIQLGMLTFLSLNSWWYEVKPFQLCCWYINPLTMIIYCDVLLCMAMYGYVWLYNVVHYIPQPETSINHHKPWLSYQSTSTQLSSKTSPCKLMALSLLLVGFLSLVDPQRFTNNTESTQLCISSVNEWIISWCMSWTFLNPPMDSLYKYIAIRSS